jgi:MinD superfamily P-loop ATPase
MLQPEIDWEICQRCDPCQARLVCKPRAIFKVDHDEPPIIELGRCNGCGACVSGCEYGAIIMKMNSTSNFNNYGRLPFP